jgi:hypothetical protein
MIDYLKIQNEKLRNLVILSQSIHSQSENEIQNMVDRIALLPPDGETAMISALEEEQKQIQLVKLSKGITSKVEKKQLEEKSLKLSAIKHEFDRAVLEAKETSDQQDATIKADALMGDI